LLIVIPTYNEIENIEAIIKAVFAQSDKFHILIVDDNSPDGTADKVREIQTIYPNRLFLEVRTEKKGLGTAYIHGFQWALARDYEYIFEMDADFSHNPTDLLRLYEACQQGADVAIGSRYVKGVNVVNWPLQRILLSYGVCYHRRVLESIDLNTIRFVGYAFQIEMKYRAYLKKFKIIEVPIIFTDRTKGKSKMNKSIIREAIFGVIGMRFKK